MSQPPASPYPPPWATTPAAPPADPSPARMRWGRAELRLAALVVAALVVLGIILGLVWWWWSPPRPVGYVIAPNAVQPDETESFVAGDGRFAVLTALAGVGAALAVWFIHRIRGPLAILALVVGGLLGAGLTELIGHAAGGGSATGPNQTLIRHLPLEVHMSGLVIVEAALAVLVYGLCVAFAASDDLDVDGPPATPPGSVGVGGQPQYGGGHGDGAGALQ